MTGSLVAQALVDATGSLCRELSNPLPCFPVLPYPASPMLPLLISAPFGNYLQPPGATATLGTFTAAPRPGRWWRALRTLRYYPRLGAWVNQIGLRNPGIDWLAARARSGKVILSNKLISIHGFSDSDWSALLHRIAELKPLAVELNLSCPNVGELSAPDHLFDRALATAVPTIVKLPPINYDAIARHALAAGVRAFHCCNTLPVPAGGMSGKPLMPLSLRCIRDLRVLSPHPLTIIGGGGVTTPDDITLYADAGATHFALGTALIHPRYLFSFARLKPLIERADRHAQAGALLKTSLSSPTP